MTLAELVQEAMEAELVNSWGRIGDSVVLQLPDDTVDMPESAAKLFLRGLLRGHDYSQMSGEE